MAITGADLLALLREGEMHIEGRLVEASNTTLRVQLSDDVRAVYKPIRGERPLWDFPSGSLAGREVAAYELSRALGWDLVPVTVMRDGPLGPGSCQLWLDDLVEPPVGFIAAQELPPDWLAVAAARDEEGNPYILAHADDPRLLRLALFDAVANNADRKGGHVLAGVDGRIYGVDHGLCLHVEHKLRTVLWGWVGQQMTPEVLEPLRRLRAALDGGGSFRDELGEHVTRREVRTLRSRVETLLAEPCFPEPSGYGPAIPWPAF
jgi:uncharacterized repeat protein (TIGR03843 family)